MIRASSYRTARTACAAPAAPTGGAHLFWGRGCGIGPVIRFVSGVSLIVFALCLGTAERADAVPVDVPSGQSVDLHEVLLDETTGELWVRFRFLAPQIARDLAGISYEQAAPDMDHLCQTLALAYLRQHQLAPARVVISLSDREVPFGQPDAAATQFFESYRPEGDSCIWEAF
ncbi:hypothetical protein PhaeoP128_01170 [Phaeobacter gallaeciensis]|nr:hypothetical protein PhaeoP129_01170 [Phaeobacter gallaeciensis]ATF21921.1 hypothetical protein PhaeoP128_01170 [Phaeobacter gallaeciensis]